MRTVVIRMALGLVVAGWSATGWSEVPRLASGKPDLQGNWDFRTLTPFERPGRFGDREFLTDEEIAGWEEAVRVGRERAANVDFDEAAKGQGTQGDVDVGYNSYYIDQGSKHSSTKRTSQVIDPPNGRVPQVKPAAGERMGRMIALQARSPEGPEDRSITDRCIKGFNAGPPMVNGAYNNIMQIVQTDDHVVVLVEMVNDHRVIPTSGGEQLPENMRFWKGDSRGVWEGDTFVVTTTNFNEHQNYRLTGPDMTLTEYFTRLDVDTLEYKFTVDDSFAYDRPWTAVVNMERTDDLVYEYACHEGNYSMPLMLRGARKKEMAGVVDETWLPSWNQPRR